MRHFLEVFNPNTCRMSPEDVGFHVADCILRLLAGDHARRASGVSENCLQRHSGHEGTFFLRPGVCGLRSRRCGRHDTGRVRAAGGCPAKRRLGCPLRPQDSAGRVTVSCDSLDARRNARPGCAGICRPRLSHLPAAERTPSGRASQPCLARLEASHLPAAERTPSGSGTGVGPEGRRSGAASGGRTRGCGKTPDSVRWLAAGSCPTIR